MNPDLLITKEAADLLEMDERTFRRWCRRLDVTPDEPARPAHGWKKSSVRRIPKMIREYWDRKLDATYGTKHAAA